MNTSEELFCGGSNDGHFPFVSLFNLRNDPFYRCWIRGFRKITSSWRTHGYTVVAWRLEPSRLDTVLPTLTHTFFPTDKPSWVTWQGSCACLRSQHPSRYFMLFQERLLSVSFLALLYLTGLTLKWNHARDETRNICSYPAWDKEPVSTEGSWLVPSEFSSIRFWMWEIVFVK